MRVACNCVMALEWQYHHNLLINRFPTSGKILASIATRLEGLDNHSLVQQAQVEGDLMQGS